MCDACKLFDVDVKIDSLVLADVILRRLANKGVKAGVLRIVSGSLKKQDTVNCQLQCTQCGQAFCLVIEPLQGAGGRFSPVAEKLN